MVRRAGGLLYLTAANATAVVEAMAVVRTTIRSTVPSGFFRGRGGGAR
jgi:hypothetical protein